MDLDDYLSNLLKDGVVCRLLLGFLLHLFASFNKSIFNLFICFIRGLQWEKTIFLYNLLKIKSMCTVPPLEWCIQGAIYQQVNHLMLVNPCRIVPCSQPEETRHDQLTQVRSLSYHFFSSCLVYAAELTVNWARWPRRFSCFHDSGNTSENDFDSPARIPMIESRNPGSNLFPSSVSKWKPEHITVHLSIHLQTGKMISIE